MVEHEGVISSHARFDAASYPPPYANPTESRWIAEYLFLHANTHKSIPPFAHPHEPALKGMFHLDIVNRNVRTRDDRLDNALSILTLPHTCDPECGGGVLEREPR